MGPLELARWAWRQLTSMRTALILLFLLALASIPGSVVPQEAVDSLRASQWRDQHPKLTPIYEQLGLFSVYNSAWFSAIYILLVISLVGCFLPRMRVYWRGVRARPPGAPRHLSRMPQHRTFETDEAPEVTLERAQAWLKRKHFRVAAAGSPDAHLGAERGYLREAGNLLFHVSVLIVLVGFAIGGLWGFKGGVTVVTKDGFANTLSQYDDFRAGTLFDPAELDPFDFTVDDFAVTFIREGREAGMAHEFAADLTYRTSPGAAEKKRKISVNHPLTIDDTDVFLISHGYAPHITVRNADRSVAFSGPVVFLPEDSTFRSFGVVKVPDARQEEGSEEHPARARGRVLPDVRLHQGERAVLRLPRHQEPGAVDARLARRPRSRRRDAAVGLRPAEEGPGPDPERRGQAAASRPRRGPHRAAARRPRDGHLRRGQPLREAPGQPHAGPEGRARRRGAGADRAARLAVHPAATDLGAGTS